MREENRFCQIWLSKGWIFLLVRSLAFISISLIPIVRQCESNVEISTLIKILSVDEENRSRHSFHWLMSDAMICIGCCFHSLNYSIFIRKEEMGDGNDRFDSIISFPQAALWRTNTFIFSLVEQMTRFVRQCMCSKLIAAVDRRRRADI